MQQELQKSWGCMLSAQEGAHSDAAAAQQLDDLALATGAHAALGGHHQVLGALVGQPHCEGQAKAS